MPFRRTNSYPIFFFFFLNAPLSIYRVNLLVLLYSSRWLDHNSLFLILTFILRYGWHTTEVPNRRIGARNVTLLHGSASVKSCLHAAKKKKSARWCGFKMFYTVHGEIVAAVYGGFVECVPRPTHVLVACVREGVIELKKRHHRAQFGPQKRAASNAPMQRMSFGYSPPQA